MTLSPSRDLVPVELSELPDPFAWVDDVFGPDFIPPVPGAYDPILAVLQQSLVTQDPDILDFSDSPQPVLIDSFAGNDRIVGSFFGDNIQGGAGNDVILGGPGDDELDGDSGYDIAVYKGSILNYSVIRIDGDEFDVVDMSHNMPFYMLPPIFGPVAGLAASAEDGDGSGDAAVVLEEVEVPLLPGPILPFPMDPSGEDGSTAFGSGTDELEDFEAIRFADYTLRLDGSNNAPFIVAPDQRTTESAPLTFSFTVYDFDGDPFELVDVTKTQDDIVGALFEAEPPFFTPSFLGNAVTYTFDYFPSGPIPGLGAGETIVDTVTLTVVDTPYGGYPGSIFGGGLGGGGIGGPLLPPLIPTPATTTLSFDIVIVGENDAPIAVADTAVVNEDGSIEIDVLANDTDADDDPLFLVEASAENGTVELPSLFSTPDEPTDEGGDGSDGDETPGIRGIDAEKGVVELLPGGKLLYTPNKDFNGVDTLTYTISDGSEVGGTSTTTVTITVNPVNDNPVANADSAMVDEDDTVIINVLGNDTDVDGDMLSVISASAANGHVSINPDDGTLNYTPNPNFNGRELITYEISDGKGGMATGRVGVTVKSVNDAPVAVPDTATVEEDGTVIVDVLANDTDVEGDALFITGLSGINGTASLTNDHKVRFIPDPDFVGTAFISYAVRDSNGAVSDTILSPVEVTPVNDAPTTTPGTITAEEDDGPITIDLSSFVTEVDGDALSFSLIAADRDGDLIPFSVQDKISLGDNGLIVVNPEELGLNDGESASTTFSYTVTDDSGDTGNDTATGTVALTINGADEDDLPIDPPVPDVFVGTTDLVINADEAGGLIEINLADLVSDLSVLPESVTSLLTNNFRGLGFNQNVSFLNESIGEGSAIAIDPTQFYFQLGTSEQVPGVANDQVLSEGEMETQVLTFGLREEGGQTTTAVVTLNLTGDTPENNPPTAGGFVATDVIVDNVPPGDFVLDLDSFAFDADGDPLSFTITSLTLGGDDAAVEIGLENIALDDATNEVTIKLDAINAALPDGSRATGQLSFTVTDGTDTVSSNVSIPFFNPTDTPIDPEPLPPLAAVLNFEELESDTDAFVPIGLSGPVAGEGVVPIIVDGYFFQGPATVFETDELSGRTAPAEGITSGQTTPDGSNVLVVGQTETVALEQVPLTDDEGVPFLNPDDSPVLGFPGSTVVLNDEGEPVIGPDGMVLVDSRDVPTTTTQVDNTVNIYAEGTTADVNVGRAAGGFISSSLTDEEIIAVFFPGDAAPTSFNLDGLSLNVAGDGEAEVTVTVYDFVVERIGSGSFISVDVNLEAIDSFVFKANPNTPAELLDFNDAGFADDAASPNTNSAAFDDILAVSITADDNSFVVLDDILLSQPDDIVPV